MDCDSNTNNDCLCRHPGLHTVSVVIQQLLENHSMGNMGDSTTDTRKLGSDPYRNHMNHASRVHDDGDAHHGDGDAHHDVRLRRGARGQALVRKQYQPSLLQVLSRGFFQWSVS